MRIHSPTTIEDACAVMAQGPGAPTPIAGATDLLVHWPANLKAHERDYLDLTRIDSLRPIRWSADTLTLGALTTYWDVVRDERIAREFPLLVTAARQVGAVQIQSRGTWAGNIANASPAADGVPVLMAYDAVVVLRSSGGEEAIRLDEFYLDYKKMRKRPDQLITEIRIPRRTHSVAIFEKVGARKAQAISKVSLAITRSDAGWRIVAGAVAPTIRRCKAIEALLDARTPVTGPGGLLTALRADISPIDDIRSTKVYRERVLARLLYHDLRGVCPWFV